MIPALSKIADRLDELAKAADDLHPIDPHEIRVCTIQLRAQIEMAGRDLHTSNNERAE